jgi:predicted TIM-barrel fold metal-dependent hydrolase
VPEAAPGIDRPPSQYFRAGSCFLTAEPDERMVAYVADTVGETVTCYASDYCHWDCAFPDTVRIVSERDDLTPERKVALLGVNAARLYALPHPVAVG